MKRLHFIIRNWHKEKSTVACGFSPIKIHYFDYLKRFMKRINESCVLSIKNCCSDTILKTAL